MIGLNLKINVRKKAIGQLAADKALELPILSSGFWFHSDVRDNFYYAIHLFAYCVDKELGCDWSEEKRKDAKNLALDMIGKVLSLQMKNSYDPMYGHWPLNLGNDPYTAKPNELPVELMGCLLILFCDKYQEMLPLEVYNDCRLAISHIYKSNLYRQPIIEMYHHDAKHTSLKLLLGQLFNDSALMEQGLAFAKLQLRHIKQFGFKEYGILPWHWHWIQSFTCVWEVVKDTAVHETMSDLLDYLWRLRVDYYLKGTWVGAHSRQWPHDATKDNNTLLDYIQFGDFPLPSEITRLEGAALYTYQVADDLIRLAVDRTGPMEIKRKIQFAKADGIVTEEVHTYVFITPEYAVGGIWERRNEFDNEQQRWDITLPLTSTHVHDSVNQAFFFHPGAKYDPGDDRHASPYGEVLYHKDTVMQMWNVPSEEKDVYPNLIGCLPKGEWNFENSSGYGRVEDIYLTFQLMNEFKYEEKTDRMSITSPLASGWNGVIMEAVSCKDAAGQGIHDLESFTAALKGKNKSLFTIVGISPASVEKVAISYTTWRNDKLQFTMDSLNECDRLLNDRPLSYSNYLME